MTQISTRLLRKLPIELMREHIMPMTYQRHSRELLCDIHSFVEDIRIIENSFYNCYSDYERFHTYHLFHTLVLFCNKFEPARLSIYRQNTRLATKMLKDTYNNTKRKNRLLIGFMTPKERTNFINEYIISQDPSVAT